MEKVALVEKSPQVVPVANVRVILEDFFPGRKSRIHQHDICDVGCTCSREEISREEGNKDKKKEKLFNHPWLSEANIA